MLKIIIILISFLFQTSAYGSDLKAGFLSQEELTTTEIQQLTSYHQLPKASRKITPDKKWILNCGVQGDKKCQKEIPLFSGVYGLSMRPLPLDDQKPWLNYNVTEQDEALQLGLAMQKYVYEGWIKEVSKKNQNNSLFHFKKNKERTWCVVPWMNVIQGNDDSMRKGRDIIHGLTKEFPIGNSEAYPNIPFNQIPIVDRKTKEIKLDESGQPILVDDTDSFSSYGVAYFNRPNCEHLQNIFGDEKNPKNPLDWIKARQSYNDNPSKVKNDFETQDGSVSFKMLFTTLQAKKSEYIKTGIYPILEKAYKWVAHVSTHRNNSPRIIQEVSHIQMDIAVKDSGIIGLKQGQKARNDQEIIPWIMLTYYFDPNYSNPLFDLKTPNHLRLSDEEIALAPQGLKHMRPLGLQYGLDQGQSVIFSDEKLKLAANNHLLPKSEVSKNGTRLNGPADNPESSCLGCHASAGYDTFYKVLGLNRIGTIFGEPETGKIHGVFGVLDNQTYIDKVSKQIHMDFNQQIRIAIQRYIETPQ